MQGPSGCKRTTSTSHLRCSKRHCTSINQSNENFATVIESWIGNEDSSDSDIDDIGEDYHPEHSDHNTDTSTDVSDTENRTPPQIQHREQLDKLSFSSEDDVPLSRLSYFRGKNKYKWAKSPPNRSSIRTPQHNIISRVPTSNLTENDRKDPYSIWKKYIDNEMLLEIVKWSNIKLANYRSKYAKENRPELPYIYDRVASMYWTLDVYRCI